MVKRNNPIRVLRDNVVIFEGALESLRRFKDDVNEVRAGTECGIGVKNYQDVRVGRPDRVLLARRGARATLSVALARMSRHGAQIASHAHRRIEGELQRVLSELISREVKDPRVGQRHHHGGEGRRRT